MKPMASVGQNKIRGTFLGDEVLAVNGSEAAICIYIYIYTYFVLPFILVLCGTINVL